MMTTVVDEEDEETSFLQNIGKNPYVINERLSRTVGWSNANNNDDDDYMNARGNGLDYRVKSSIDVGSVGGKRNTISSEKQSE